MQKPGPQRGKEEKTGGWWDVKHQEMDDKSIKTNAKGGVDTR